MVSEDFKGLGDDFAGLVAMLRGDGQAKRCACGEEFFGVGADCWTCHQREIRRAEAGPMVRQFIPTRYREQGFDQYRCPPGDAKARDRVRLWGGKAGLMLWSRTKGTGKSHLAYALLQARATEGRIAALEWTEYLEARKAAMTARTADEGLDAKLRAMRTADLALIDDLGSGRMTEWALTELWSLVNARYLASKPTLVTCNYAPTLLPQRLAQGGDVESAERIVSRLAEMCEPVEVQAQDYRLRRQG